MTNQGKRRILRLFVAALPAAAFAPYSLGQNYIYTPGFAPAPPVVAVQVSPAPAYSADQLDQMLGPIALYPDPLLSEVLAAATYPQDVAAANDWLQHDINPTEYEISIQGWDASVKALAHYPEVLRMMAGNMNWTGALGMAFAYQPQEVMDAVQRLRVRAVAARTLGTTPQQEVVNDNGVILILPARPDVIYVPQYDPEVVYYTTPGYVAVTFGSPYAVGIWFDLGWDWHRRVIDRGVRWGQDWHHPDFGHIEPWVHDRGRPIPLPRSPYVPPGNWDNHRGWSDPGRAPGVFNAPPRVAPRVGERRGALPPVRPVQGLPRAPEGRVLPPAPVPVPVGPVPALRIPRPAPVAPIPAGGGLERGRGSPPAVGRPVTGLPPRPPTPPAPPRTAAPAPPPRAPSPAAPAPTQRPLPAPGQRSAPTERPAPARGPAPAFQPGGGDGGASERGHSSMQR